MTSFIVCVLCALVVLKPQEFVPALSGLPLLYLVFGLFTVAFVADVLRGRARVDLPPHLSFVLAFFLWGALVTLVRRPARLQTEGLDLAIVFCIFGVISLGLGNTKALRRFCWTLLLCMIFATTVAIVQSRGPWGCMIADKNDWEGKGELQHDGRGCETVLDCRRDGLPDVNYRCERVGPFGTATIGGRVRYRGTLADPNELSLAAVMALPFALAFAERRRAQRDPKQQPTAASLRLPLLLTDTLLSKIESMFRVVPALLVAFAFAVMIILSQSRMGVLVFLVVMGLAFIRRAGVFGVVIGCLAFPPLLLLGGRSGAEAEASADERLDLVAEALMMIKRSKGIGFGVGQFADESTLGLTAHNSYLLAAAETGIIGACLFSLVLYGALKIPLKLWFGSYDVDAELRRLAPALAISLVGAYVGIFFLSWSYKEFLYMQLGASAALYQAARAEDARFSVRIDLREALTVCGLCLLLFPIVWIVLHVVG
ncbi:O-antigen ligase family protein [Polyangium spumosum]|uniref:O-antigen ligase domain-containing protein n=1 Tax=Polyangium spumosum TaxID=889282 RepID=A0A6N7PET8_9BACT|nr:O-antigen ligase family protein [Polyangium spumosum]MRG90479.1 O-antigen ligase domain-containing protein [Polyangium spumosum]